MSRILDKYGVLALCFLGTLIRIIYGYIYEPWNQAPDHLAWELVIEQQQFSYDHLIHYPHEGGSILISLLSSIIELFTNFSSLTISALIIDFSVRLIQINVVKKIFNTRIAVLFGLWTIFAVPIIIPWGTLNFGLHSIASVFPFLLLWVLSKYNNTVKQQFLSGAFLGFAFWFSYSNIILIPAFFIYLIISKVAFKNWKYCLLGLSIILGFHILVREFMDPGFHLHEFQSNSIRGEVFSLSGVNIWERIFEIPQVMANSVTALPHPIESAAFVKVIFYASCLLAIIGFIIDHQKEKFSKFNVVIISMILIFYTLYLLSPFYNSETNGNHIVFRHLTYITPLLFLFIIIGLSAIKYKVVIIPLFFIGIFQSICLFKIENKHESEIPIKAAGWVLAKKLGHQPETLISIIEDNPEKRDLLIQGVAWGTSGSLLINANPKEATQSNQKIKDLIELLLKYPESYQINLYEGLKFSFSDQVTPLLNQDLLEKTTTEYNYQITAKSKLPD